MGGDPRLAAGHLGASPHSPARNRVTPDRRGPRTPSSWLVWLGVCSWGPLALWSACAPAFAQQPTRFGRVQRTRPSPGGLSDGGRALRPGDGPHLETCRPRLQTLGDGAVGTGASKGVSLLAPRP